MKLRSIIAASLLTLTLANASTNETVTLEGNKVHLTGTNVSVGDKAPEIKLITSALKEITVGGTTKNTQVLVVVPSIDTPVCDLEAHKFNEEASKLSGVNITVISMDLPFAGQRYCAAHGIENITVASDFQTKAFSNAYGTLINDTVLKGIDARAIFIVKNSLVTYKQLVSEITQAPDYTSVLKAIN